MTTCEVSLARLDDLVRGTPVRLIKIDVEGYELEVLRGAERLLAARPIIVLEVSLSFLIERLGIYQEELAIASRFGYRPAVVRNGDLVLYEWPAERVFNLWLYPNNVGRHPARRN